MPKILKARPPRDDGEERKIRKLAGARHAPADWTERARIITLSWDGLGVPAIAEQLGFHPKKVRRWLHRFNAAGIDGLGNRPGGGRKRRITEAQRSAIIALARSAPPGRLARDGAGELSADDEDGPAQWTLDTLSQAARDAGIDGLGDRPGAGRRRRITGAERSAIIALARSAPPGRLERDADGELSAEAEEGPRSGRWTPSPRRPGTPASPWAAASCGGSCWRRRCAGGGPAAGWPAPTRSSPRKDPHRGAVHRPAGGLHGDLRR
jgi:transposase